MLDVNRIYNINCLDGLKRLPDKFIDMTITSPPYWGLRDYGEKTVSIWDGDERCEHNWDEYTRDSNKYDRKPTTGSTGKQAIKGSTNYSCIPDKIQGFCSKCGAWKGQLGLEPHPDLYVKHLCDIYDEVKRVTKDTGTCWVNLGDSYSGSGMGTWNPPTDYKSKQVYFMAQGTAVANKNIGIPKKSLAMIPFRFALEMVNRGWILRNTIIWYKPNAMPSSVKDRFTVDFEYLFFFSKNRKYYFERQFEQYQMSNVESYKKQVYTGQAIKEYDAVGVQNASDVKRRCLKSMQEGIGRNMRTVWKIKTRPFPDAHFAVFPEELVETPIKAGCPEVGIVLDPFIGSGTTAVVARKLNRNFIGFEINPEYIDIAKRRLSKIVTLNDWLE